MPCTAINSISQLPQKWLSVYEDILYSSPMPGCHSHDERADVALRETLRLYRREKARLDELKCADLFDAKCSFNPDNKRKHKKERA